MPNGFSSQAGHLIMRTQAAQGTFQSDLTTAGVAIKTTGGSMVASRTLMIPTPEIGGSRDIPDAYLGPSIWQGQFSFYARLNSFLTILAAGLGIVGTPVTTTGVTTQTITPSDAAGLPFLSLEEEIGANLDTYDYTDAVVNSLHLESASDGYLMGNADFIALKQVDNITPTDPTTLFDNGPLTVGTNITLTYNGASISAKNIKLDVKNNFETNDFRMGSFFAGSLVPKRRDVTGSFLFRPSDATLFRQAVYGASALNAVGGLVTKQQMVITMSTYELIPSSTPPTVYSLTITLPKVAFLPFSFAPSGDNIIDTDISFQVLRPAIATPLMTCVAKTGLALIA
jgi:hypothetical protein